MRPSDEEPRLRFRIACKILRQAGHLDTHLPGQRAGESPIDWLVRLGLAPDPHIAAEMLIVGKGLANVLDELMADEEVAALFHPCPTETSEAEASQS